MIFNKAPLNRCGSASILLSTLLLCLMLFCFGVWAVLRAEKKSMALQLEVDACVGKTAQNFKQLQEDIVSLNQKIKLTRIALLATTLEPPIRTGLQITLKGLVLLQDQKQRHWKLEIKRWDLGLGCEGLSGSGKNSLYSSWKRPPPDALGENPLNFIEPQFSKLEEPYHVEFKSKNRSAGASAFKNFNAEKGKYDWRIQWSSPKTRRIETRTSFF